MNKRQWRPVPNQFLSNKKKQEVSLKQDWRHLIWVSSANDVTYQGFFHKTMACFLH